MSLDYPNRADWMKVRRAQRYTAAPDRVLHSPDKTFDVGMTGLKHARYLRRQALKKARRAARCAS